MCTSSACGPGSTVCMPGSDTVIVGLKSRQKCTRFSVYISMPKSPTTQQRDGLACRGKCLCMRHRMSSESIDMVKLWAGNQIFHLIGCQYLAFWFAKPLTRLLSKQHKLAAVWTYLPYVSAEGWLVCLLLVFTNIQIYLYTWQKAVCFFHNAVTHRLLY